MKIVRFKAAGKTRYGVLDGTHIVEYSGTPYGTFKRGRKRWPVKQAVLLAPVVPTKIVALALNYYEHAEEMHRAALRIMSLTSSQVTDVGSFLSRLP